MTIFKKIKSITVGELGTRYTVELVCARCNHFADQVVLITPPKVFIISEITWASPHICDLPNELKALKKASFASRKQTTGLEYAKQHLGVRR